MLKALKFEIRPTDSYLMKSLKHKNKKYSCENKIFFNKMQLIKIVANTFAAMILFLNFIYLKECTDLFYTFLALYLNIYL